MKPGRMIATAIANYRSEVARPLGNNMEVATKSKGFSVEEYCGCADGNHRGVTPRLDDPFRASTLDFGKADKELVEQDENKGGKSRGGEGGGGKGKGGKLTAAPASPVKSAYSVSVCNHCGERGRKKADCRN